MRRNARHRLGTTLIVVGALLLAYAAVTLAWRDPITDLYARYQQHELAGELRSAWPDYRIAGDALPVDESARAQTIQRQVAESARDYAGRLERSGPMGRLLIPRLDLDTIFVHGTRWGPDLSRGPGHYERTSVPGLGRTTAIAGHRTTFGAPLRKIDRLRPGDEITLELPYGRFRYEVFAHEIVANDDWSIIRERGFDTIVLSACHPLYSAAQRWIVYGRLVEVEPDGAEAYVLAGDREARLAG